MLQYFQDMHLLYEAIDAMPEYFIFFNIYN